MIINVLASGSKGNSTYIESKDTKILVDIGMSCNYIENNLKELNINPRDLDGILLTHLHNDHICGLKVFCKKYNTKIYLSSKMVDSIKDIVNIKNVNYISKEMCIKDINIEVIKTSHDTESYGYIFDDNLVYVTDTGYINVKYFDMLKNKKAYIIESNHDIETLINGEYPYVLKQRILSDRGHLSNKDCSYYLSQLTGDNTKYVVLAHLSENNNTKEKALEEYRCKNDNKNIKVIVATQNERIKSIII